MIDDVSNSSNDKPLDAHFHDQLEHLLDTNDERLLRVLNRRGYRIAYTPRDVYEFARDGDVDNLKKSLLMGAVLADSGYSRKWLKL